MHSVRLVPFALKSAGIVSSIYQGLSGLFSVAVEKVSIDYHASFDANRDQYHSTELLRCLLNHFPDKRVKVLGITSLDLFIPILTFVFGEAQLDEEGHAHHLEIRSVNNRYFKSSIRLPDDFAFLETQLEQLLRRGLGHHTSGR